jgi:uncharacterized protein YbaR (Trm112 family)
MKRIKKIMVCPFCKTSHLVDIITNDKGEILLFCPNSKKWFDKTNNLVLDKK